MNNPRKQIRLKNFDYSSEASYFITLRVKHQSKILCDIVDETIILSEIGKIADQCMKAIPDHFPNAKLDEYCIMPDHIHCILFIIKNPEGINGGIRHFMPPLLYNNKPSPIDFRKDITRDVQLQSGTDLKLDVPSQSPKDITRDVQPKPLEDITRIVPSPSCKDITRDVPPPPTPSIEAPPFQFNKFGCPIKGSISVIIQQFKSSITRECNKKGLGKITWHGRFHDHIIHNEAQYEKIRDYIRNNPSNWKQPKFMRP